MEAHIRWLNVSTENRAGLDSGTIRFRPLRSTRGTSQEESQGDLGHSTSSVSHRPTEPKGNTSEGKPRDKASRQHCWSCKAYHAPAPSKALGRKPHTKVTHASRRASPKGYQATEGRWPREGNKPSLVAGAQARGSMLARVRRPCLLETKTPELYFRARNTIIASWVLY